MKNNQTFINMRTFLAEEVKQRFLLWFSVAVLTKLLPMICIALLSWKLADSFVTIRDPLNLFWTVGFMAICAFLSAVYDKLGVGDLLAGKLYLTMARQPELVKQHFWQAFIYNARDGFLQRFFYSILYLLHGGICLGLFLFVFFKPFISALLGEDGNNYGYLGVLVLFIPVVAAILFALCLGIFSIVFAPSLFLLPFIIHDTCSRDNQQKSLNYWQAYRKSRKLMKGWKKKLFFYLGLQDVLTLALMTPTILFAASLKLTPNSFPTGHLLSIILGTGFITIAIIVRAFWANDLTEADPEIVDFGD